MARSTDDKYKDFYWKIQYWMVSDLKLSGNELLLYGLIYTFAREGKKAIFSQSDISQLLNCSARTARRSIDYLYMERGLIAIVSKNTQKGEFKLLTTKETKDYLSFLKGSDENQNLGQNVISLPKEERVNLGQNDLSTTDKMSQALRTKCPNDPKQYVNNNKTIEESKEETDTESSPSLPLSSSLTETEPKPEKAEETDPTKITENESEERKINRRFLTFWTMYPEHRKKPADYEKARRLWIQFYPTDTNFYQKICSCLEESKDSRQWTDDNGDFVPSILKFITSGKWKNQTSLSARYTDQWEQLDLIPENKVHEMLDDVLTAHIEEEEETENGN